MLSVEMKIDQENRRRPTIIYNENICEYNNNHGKKTKNTFSITENS